MRTLESRLVFLLAVSVVACSQGSVLSSPAAPTASLPASGSPLHSTQGGGRLPATLPVTTILSATDSYGMPADISGGTYADNTGYLTANGYNGIAYGDWQFLKSTTGTISISFGMPGEAVLVGDPHYTAPANPPFFGTQALVGHMEVKCTFLSKSMLTMTPGSMITCPLLPAFTASDGVEYGLPIANSFTGFAETTDVQIVCNAVETTVLPTGCSDWYIDPIASLGQTGVARLTTTSATKRGGEVDDGDFNIKFHFHITRP